MKKLTFVFLVLSCSFAFSQVTLKTKDITPRFFAFFDLAKKETDKDKIWKLWKEHYNFAAVPPTEEGQKMARKLLENAWYKYPSQIKKIKKSPQKIEKFTQNRAQEIAKLFNVKDKELQLLLFVGALEDNAYTYGNNGKATIAIAVDTNKKLIFPMVTHELAHAIQIAKGSFSGGWERTVGTTILTEGLAMRVAEYFYPNVDKSIITDHKKNWYAETLPLKKQIIQDISKRIYSKNFDDIMAVTMGKNTVGVERSAYFVGWLIVGKMLEEGKSFEEISAIKEDEMPKIVAQYLSKI